VKFNFDNISLRQRLLLSTLAVAAVGIIGSDFAAHTAVQGYLIKQVDQQLTGITNGVAMRLDRAGIQMPGNDDGGTSAGPIRPVNPIRRVPTSTTITLLDLKGNTLSQLGGDYGNAVTKFHGLDQKAVEATKGAAFTISGVGEAPDMRAIAQVLPSGLGSVVVSTSLSDVEKTTHELLIFFLFFTAFVLFLIGIIAFYIIKLSLRPLGNIEVTAAAIADGDYSARLPVGNSKTEVGRLASSLNTMLGKIEGSFAARVESENRLRRFVADASHELRTPLTAIRGFAELHRQGAVSGEEKTKELVGRIEKESIRMGGLVEDLLLLARMDQSPQLNLHPIDLNQIVSDCVASARAAGPTHPITVTIAEDENYALGDNNRVHQALQNLLANARVHTPAGTTISISIENLEDETVLKVADNGPGLAKEMQEKIFERFFRADPSRVRTSGGEGSGLGLSIVDAVMKAHLGRVEVSSEPGKGALFSLHFPMASE